jgi:hypothetical protein
VRGILSTVPLNRLKIGILHHNPSSVPSDDIEAFDTIINAGRLKMCLISNKFDIVLHGHRHILHCSHERFPRWSKDSSQGIFFIGADSIGCRPHAPFVKIEIIDGPNAHDPKAPASIVRATEYHYDSRQYIPNNKLALEPIHRPLYGAMTEILRNIGRTEPVSNRSNLVSAIGLLTPHIAHLREYLLDWGEGSSEWIEKFHLRLDDYCQIFATDVQARASLESPRYGRYLRDQYHTRFSRLMRQEERTLTFTNAVL